MENDQFSSSSSSLFGLTIDVNSKAFLSETARWARFLSIVGFIVCGFIVLVGIFAGSFFSMFAGGIDDAGGLPAGVGGVMAIFYVLIALVYFFPCLFLFRFATQMKIALASDDQTALNTSLQNLKSVFRFMGIITIIILSIYAIMMLIALVGAAAMG